jgi:hypothetical protein
MLQQRVVRDPIHALGGAARTHRQWQQTRQIACNAQVRELSGVQRTCRPFSSGRAAAAAYGGDVGHVGDVGVLLFLSLALYTRVNLENISKG